MRIWIRTAILLSLAVGLAVFMRSNDDTVRFIFSTEIYEIRLNFFVLALIVLMTLVYGTLRFLEWFVSIPLRIRLWKKQRQLERQQAKLEQAWLSFIDGRIEHAQQDLRLVARRSKDNVQRQMVALLSGIRALHANNDADKIAAMLAEARNLCIHHQKFVPYVAIVESEVLIEQQKPEEAYTHLQPFFDQLSKFPHIIRLRLRIAHDLAKHEEVVEMARLAHKRRLLADTTIQSYIRTALVEWFYQVPNLEALQTAWKQTKGDERSDPEIVQAAATAYAKLEKYKEAQEILEHAIEKSHQLVDGLFAAYARAPESFVQHRIAKAEGWIKKFPQNAALLQALGILCIQARIWGAAQKYLEQSLQIADVANTRVLLANLFDGLGKEEQAKLYWRTATQQVLNLPHITVGIPLVKTPTSFELNPDEPDRSVGF